jgi:hypothetical protein
MSSVPPPYPFPPAAAAAAEPGAVARLLAGVLGLFTAVLVIVGSFLPFWAYEESSGGKVQASQTVTGWTRLFGIEPTAAERSFYDTSHVARYGIPLTVVSMVLIVGAVLVFGRARNAGRITLVAGGAGMVAAVWMLGMDLSATLSYNQETNGTTLHYASGTGFWVLLAGGVVALITLGLALFSGRRPRTPGIAAAPPFGYPGAPEYGNSVSAQYHGPAYGGPVSQPFPPQSSAPMPLPEQLPAQEEGPGRHRTTDEPNT